jgi:hypothetical protein
MREFGLSWPQFPTAVRAVTCSRTVIFTVKKKVRDQLLIHRFSHTGALIDALRIDLAELGQFFPQDKLPELWEIRAADEHLEITIGEYSYPKMPYDGGVLDHRVTYTAQLHAS